MTVYAVIPRAAGLCARVRVAGTLIRDLYLGKLTATDRPDIPGGHLPGSVDIGDGCVPFQWCLPRLVVPL